MMKIIMRILFFTLFAGLACKGGCDFSSMKEKAEQYKDKMTPDKLEKAKEIMK